MLLVMGFTCKLQTVPRCCYTGFCVVKGAAGEVVDQSLSVSERVRWRRVIPDPVSIEMDVLFVVEIDQRAIFRTLLSEPLALAAEVAVLLLKLGFQHRSHRLTRGLIGVPRGDDYSALRQDFMQPVTKNRSVFDTMFATLGKQVGARSWIRHFCRNRDAGTAHGSPEIPAPKCPGSRLKMAWAGNFVLPADRRKRTIFLALRLRPLFVSGQASPQRSGPDYQDRWLFAVTRTASIQSCVVHRWWCG